MCNDGKEGQGEDTREMVIICFHPSKRSTFLQQRHGKSTVVFRTEIQDVSSTEQIQNLRRDRMSKIYIQIYFGCLCGRIGGIKIPDHRY